MESSVFLWTFLGVLVVYAWPALCLHVIASKTGTPAPWLAWIPIANFYLMCKVARMSGWLLVPFFIPLINIIVVAGVWMEIAERVGMSRALGLLAIIPLLNIVILSVLAFTGREYSGQTAL